MACTSKSYPECGVAQPTPVTGTSNEPCVRQCPDSEVVITPPPVVVTIPGPILSNYPQHSEVGAVGAPVVGAGYGGSFGLGSLYGYGSVNGGLYGLGGYGGYGGHNGYRGLCGYAGGYGGLRGYRGGYGGLCGYGGGYGGLWGYPGRSGYGGIFSSRVSCHRYLSGSCGPC